MTEYQPLSSLFRKDRPFIENRIKKQTKQIEREEIERLATRRGSVKIVKGTMRSFKNRGKKAIESKQKCEGERKSFFTEIVKREKTQRFTQGKFKLERA